MRKPKERKPIRLTKAALEELQPEASAYFIAVVNAKGQGIQGLNVRVLPSGVKVFVHRYRFHGYQKICTLGRYPAMNPEAAEKASRSAQTKIDGGTDPLQAKTDARKAEQAARLAAFSVKDLVERYQEEHTPGNSEGWQIESKRLMNKHIVPALGKVSLREVGPGEISSFLYPLSKKTPTQANRVRAVLRTMFQRAEEWGLRPLGSNPVAVVKRRTLETKRERRLSDLELKALGTTLRASKEAPELLLAIRLALLSGMRKGEIQEAKWDWIDLETGEIRIPMDSHKTGRKTGKVRVVHLCSALVADLKCLTHTLGCPHVVPGHSWVDEEKRVQWSPFTALQNPWERIRETTTKRAKEEWEKAGSKGPDPVNIDDVTIHDLRRTFASVGADLGIKGFVGELLGHAEATVTDIYTRSAAERLHDAAEAIGGRIEGILSGFIDPEKETEDRRKAKDAKARG